MKKYSCGILVSRLGVAAPVVRRSAPRPTANYLPFRILGVEPAEDEADASKEERATHALRLDCPGELKERYYMDPIEQGWIEAGGDEFARVTGNKPGKPFFFRLYKWGVYNGAISASCSPEGLRSHYLRSAGKRPRAE